MAEDPQGSRVAPEAKALCSLGRMALHARDWDQAQAYFRQATEADPAEFEIRDIS